MKKIYSRYLIDYSNGEREEIPDLKTFYEKYIDIKKNNKMETVARWCGVNGNSFITSLSSYGLKNLFLWATEPETGGFVVRERELYYIPDGLTRELQDALIFNEEDAKKMVSYDPEQIKMIPCSIAERDAGFFNKNN